MERDHGGVAGLNGAANHALALLCRGTSAKIAGVQLAQEFAGPWSPLCCGQNDFHVVPP
jgi:hypothetical protein